VPLSAALLRVRSDEQLVSLFRAGSDDAFSVIHERYHARLLAYARQMLRSSGGDAEDALQDVFVRAFKSLRASNRPVLLRAWLYRIAHNRCIDELRRPIPVPTPLDSDASPTLSSGAAQDPSVLAERSEAVARLVADVRALPPPQRSALLMRELQGLSYQELSMTLGVSVPAVKSLLLRARTGLVDLKLARDTPCAEIMLELAEAADRGVRMNARSRRHVRECDDCDAFHRRQRDLHKHLAALLPVGPLGKLLGLFGFGGGGGAGGGMAAGGATAGGAAGGGAGGAGVIGGLTVAKVAAVVATAAVIGTAGGAAVQAVGGPKPPASSARLPADADQLTQTTGATVGPSAPAAQTGAASTSAGTSGSPTGQPLLAAVGVTGESGVSGASGTTGASGDTGSSGATGDAAPPATSPDAGSTVAYPLSAPEGPTGPTATVASVPAAGSSGSSGSSGTGGSTDSGRISGPSGPSGTIGSSGPAGASTGLSG
jgi:RNA polymerase sigma factor (sigma-70 family)